MLHMIQSNVTPNRKRTYEELCRAYEELQVFIVVIKSSAHMKRHMNEGHVAHVMNHVAHMIGSRATSGRNTSARLCGTVVWVQERGGERDRQTETERERERPNLCWCVFTLLCVFTEKIALRCHEKIKKTPGTRKRNYTEC